MNRKLFLSGFLCLAGAFCFSQEAATDDTLSRLLTGFLQNDLELQKLTATAQSAELTRDSTNIENNIALNLSTGTMIIRPSAQGTTFEITPEVSASVPVWNNTKLTASGDVTVSSIESENEGLTNASVNLSTEILGSSGKQAQLKKTKAERAYLVACRNLQNRALSAEKDFYTQLEQLLSEAAKVLSNEQDLYEEEVDFKKIKAQGYTQTSSSYRTQELKVRTAQRTLDESKRNFVYLQNVLASKCGQEIHHNAERPNSVEEAKAQFDAAYEAAWNFLPSSIPEVEGVEPTSFKKEDYTKIESANYEKQLGELTRDADSDLTLGASAGYTFRNTSGVSDSSLARDTIDTGLTFSWKGLVASAGVSFPVGSDDNTPFYKMSLGFSPSTFMTSQLKDKQKKLEVQLEDIAVKDAEEDFRTTMVSERTSLSNLRWSKISDTEELELYTQLEKDNQSWFKQGIITESDYKASQVNKKKAEITKLVNAADFIIYNDTVKLLFVNDGTSSEQNKTEVSQEKAE